MTVDASFFIACQQTNYVVFCFCFFFPTCLEIALIVTSAIRSVLCQQPTSSQTTNDCLHLGKLFSQLGSRIFSILEQALVVSPTSLTLFFITNI